MSTGPGRGLVQKTITVEYDLPCRHQDGIEIHRRNKISSYHNEEPNQMERSDTASEVSCPHCGSTTVDRTRRKGILERIILYPLGYRAYRCEICDMRFRSRPKQ